MEWLCPRCSSLVQQQAGSDPPGPCPRCGAPLARVPGAETRDSALQDPDETTAAQAGQGTGLATRAEAPPAGLPTRVGRYAVRALLGRGGFGTVYLGHDEELDRPVAIKVPLPGRLPSGGAAELFLREARTAAGLRHLGIVAIYDVGRLPDGTCYFVMEYVHGRSLADLLAEGRPDCRRAAELLLHLADAVHHAHQQGFVHRDLKPSNVLIDQGGRAHVADFGLAVQGRDRRPDGEVAGTPMYMAPEQVRGESHRLDARTDVWALGVILYELLTGRPPFAGRREQVFHDILHRDPTPPRQLDDTVPRGLERICLKCLAKRMADRYPGAGALADDLRYWLGEEGERSTVLAAPAAADGTAGRVNAAPTSSVAVTVVPRGLRSFGAQDAEFFLRLLPGPRDRDGLPESLAFWKTRLEETDPDRTFSVGVLYGPSGCGKSSLVKAGLLPHLAGHVLPVYLEATPAGTEARLLRLLHKHCPSLPEGLDLVQALAALREGGCLPPGRKLVLVLDQFEQWLHAGRAGSVSDRSDPELVRALRQCDGRRVQCLLLVRDDFWMAISRCMRDLEVPLREGENSAAVDLFGPSHARKVLAEFGRAYGCLPPRQDELSAEQGQFLDRVVADLMQDGKIIPVRLSLFAEMVKARAWELATLRALGGSKGVGVRFLEETFGAAAPPEHRRHAPAARGVLQALLPAPGTDLKAAVRPHHELFAASGYSRREDFDDLVRILDTELRLVTPADAEGQEADTQAPSASAGTAHAVAGAPNLYAPPTQAPSASAGMARHYQLTHDYLVPVLRDWLQRKQRESWRGRAELTLTERTAQWGRARDPRFLPSWGEYLRIQLGVPPGRRTPDQQALLRTTALHHGARWALGVVAVILAVAAVGQYVAQVRQASRQQRAEGLVERVLQAPPEGVPYKVEDLRPVRDLAVPLLRARFADEALDPRQRLHAAVALAAFDEGPEEFLLDSIATAPASEGGNVLAALARARDAVLPRLAERLAAEQAPQVRLRLAATLLQLGDAGAARELLAYRPDPARRTAFLQEFASWRGDLAELPALLRGAGDPALRSGLCAAVGSVRPDVLEAGRVQELEEALRDVYRRAPDGGSHSAAGWALRQWGAALPPPEPPAGGAGWFVNRHGVTMLALAPGRFTMGEDTMKGATPHEVTLTRPFFLCDREVSMDLYAEFLADPDPAVEKPAEPWRPDRQEVSPTGDCPAHMVSWDDAVLFCNWLSLREGRRPCYTRIRQAVRPAGGGPAKEADVWRCDFEADGYRLPTEAEWKYACRAGTTTFWACGREEDWLPAYAVFLPRQAAPVGSRLPNAWGLFDMHGNAREWCWDFYAANYPPGPVTDPRGPETGTDHIHRGGSWYDRAEACRSAFRNQSAPTLRDRIVGFRVACGGGPVN